MAECTFCLNCGTLVDEAKLCQNTKCIAYGQPRGKDYLEKRLNEGEVKDSEWFEKQAKFTTHKTQYYACHNCNYLMWHRLNWCPKCGGNFVELNTTYKEMKEKYGSYRTGY